MPNLPIFQTQDQTLLMLQTKWKQEIQPVIQNPLNQGQLVEAELINGATVINHKLGRKMVGWMIVDINEPATIYRSAALNNLTLTLTSNMDANVLVWVF